MRTVFVIVTHPSLNFRVVFQVYVHRYTYTYLWKREPPPPEAKKDDCNVNIANACVSINPLRPNYTPAEDTGWPKKTLLHRQINFLRVKRSLNISVSIITVNPIGTYCFSEHLFWFAMLCIDYRIEAPFDFF